MFTLTGVLQDSQKMEKYNLRLTFQLKHHVTCCGRPHLDSLQTPLLEKHPRITISEHCFAAPFWNTRFEHNFKTQLRNTLSGLSFGPPCPNAVAQTSFDTASGDSFGKSLLHTASENNLQSCIAMRGFATDQHELVPSWLCTQF